MVAVSVDRLLLHKLLRVGVGVGVTLTLRPPRMGAHHRALPFPEPRFQRVAQIPEDLSQVRPVVSLLTLHRRVVRGGKRVTALNCRSWQGLYGIFRPGPRTPNTAPAAPAPVVFLMVVLMLSTQRQGRQQ